MRAAAARPPERKRASKKQTPFSVWYSSSARDCRKVVFRLKEADAFQRLVFVSRVFGGDFGAGLKEADAFQRLVSVCAATARTPSSRLKEADAFQRLVLGGRVERAG